MERALSLRNKTPTHPIDPNEVDQVTKLFEERLQAFKHACGYLEDYIKAMEKDQSSRAKDMEKVLKSVSHPLKEGHHFDPELGGIAAMFENIRQYAGSLEFAYGDGQDAQGPGAADV
jgi:hypothetical protein